MHINQRLTEICGISVDDHLGRSVRDCVPALAAAVEQIVKTIVATGEPITGIEVTGQRPGVNDERSWVTYWHPLRDSNGEIVGVNVAAEETTERKRAEREVRAAKEAAEAALHDLRKTQSSLIETEKLAALGRLVAGVAHEINNPVGVSLTVASALASRAKAFAKRTGEGDLTRSRLMEFVSAVQDGCAQLFANLTRAADLVQSFKQVAADRSNAEFRSFDAGELTRQVVRSLQPAARNLTLRVECDQDLIVYSHPGSYGQVLTNLFLNSVTHGFPDGVNGTIQIHAHKSASDKVEITVSDDGTGMSDEVKKQAFDPFFTTRRDLGCTGLGLHIVHSIVTNSLYGRLSLDSAVGKGTTVRLILPREMPTRNSI